MEEIKDEETRRSGLENLMVYDPERLPYEPQHLCVYLRELEEEGQRKRSEPGTS
jgi:hypothetical protein